MRRQKVWSSARREAFRKGMMFARAGKLASDGPSFFTVDEQRAFLEGFAREQTEGTTRELRAKWQASKTHEKVD